MQKLTTKNITPPQFDLKSFMRSGKKYQLKTFGVTLDSILAKVQERHLQNLSEDEFVWLNGEVRHAKHSRKAWCNSVECDRETALSFPYNGFTSGELGTHYFYFEHKKKRDFSEEEIEHLIKYTPCCFMNGQCCFFKLGSEDDEEYDGDLCECCMGRDNGSYSFELNLGEDTIESERQCGLIE